MVVMWMHDLVDHSLWDGYQTIGPWHHHFPVHFNNLMAEFNP
jgi:hypothetical protein